MKTDTNPEKIKRILEWGVEDIIEKNSLKEKLGSGQQLRVKLGFDPTGPNIHIGRAIALRKLKDFQDLGHKIIFIVGDFTAQIGDPSDKLEKRPTLTTTQIKKNLKNYKQQVGQIINLKKAEFIFNSKWLKKLGMQEILNLSESFSMSQIMNRRNFKERIEKGGDVSMREIIYPLMQGYDSVMVKADVEIGGFDQLFNLTAGRSVQKHYQIAEQDILTTQMLEGTDGRKMSTSWGNVINIIDAPEEMFGKVMSLKDELIEKYLRLCTNLNEDEVGELMEIDNLKDRKGWLGFEIVKLYHGVEAAGRAQEEFEQVFGKKELPSEIEVIGSCDADMQITDLLLKIDGIDSKTEARRLIEQGGVRVNSQHVKDTHHKVKIDGEVLVQVGKRRFVKFKQ